MISFSQKGNFKKMDSFLEKALEIGKIGTLDHYGRLGVQVLSEATPVDSGETANSWSYNIIRENGNTKIVWSNSHVEDGCNIAILLQYGHATSTGGFVVGRDYINPAIRPIFDDIANSVWKEVTRA